MPPVKTEGTALPTVESPVVTKELLRLPAPEEIKPDGTASPAPKAEGVAKTKPSKPKVKKEAVKTAAKVTAKVEKKPAKKEKTAPTRKIKGYKELGLRVLQGKVLKALANSKDGYLPENVIPVKAGVQRSWFLWDTYGAIKDHPGNKPITQLTKLGVAFEKKHGRKTLLGMGLVKGRFIPSDDSRKVRVWELTAAGKKKAEEIKKAGL